jgi:beta-lactamase regulating signal transducer with metallopeptidase domain
MGFLFEGGWLALVFEYLIKSSVILSVSIVLAFLLSKKSAGLRHLVLSVFLIGLLFLPILSTVTTGWETKFLPSRQSRVGANLKVDSFIGTLNSSSENLGSVAMASEVPKHTEEVKKDSPPVFGFTALLLWFFGLMFLSIRMMLGLYGTVRLSREGQDMQDSLWRRLLRRFLDAVSLKRKIHLMSHDKTKVPLTWGFFKPVVMMPEASRKWSENQQSAALFHELSHIKRGDYLVMILARISRAIYWFNPLSWIVLGMIKREQEKACDELVLKAGIKPSTYAENLLLIRNSVTGHWNPPAAVLGAMNKSHLNDRLTTILKQRFNLKEVQMRTKILLSVLAILSISFIGLARPGNSFSSHAEAASLESAAVTTWIDSHEIPADVQEQEKKEQKKEIKKGVKIEEKDKAKLVLTGKLGEKGTYELILDKDDPKKIICVSPLVKLDKHAEATWTIKADKMHLCGEMKTIELDKGTVIYQGKNKEDKDGVKFIKFDSPHVQVKKAGKDHKFVTVEVHPKVHVVIDIEKYKELIEKIKEKLAKLKVKDLDVEVKEVELEGIEKVLEELQETLKKKFEKFEHVKVHVSPKISHAYTIRTKDIHIADEKGHHAVTITSDKGAVSLIYHADIDTDQKEIYEKAIKKLEDNLPEGYSVESTFDEKEGTLSIKIINEKEEVLDMDVIKKLIKEFQEDIKTIKT